MNDKSLNYDILRELFNISVGKASSLLSEIIDRKIILDVPAVEIINIENNESNLDSCIPKKLDGIFMVSSISFEHELKGKANLIFSAEKMRTFINLCLNDKETDEYYEMNFSDVDFDVIKEIGNIVLNSVVGEVGNLLDLRLNYTLPEVKIFNRTDFIKDIDSQEYMHILILHITFLIDNTEIEGAILVRLTLNSLTEIIKKIEKIEEELYE